MEERRANLAIRHLWELQSKWTTCDVYKAYCPSVDIETDTTRQVEASRLFVRKTAGTVQRIDAWVEQVTNFHATQR
jgi:hypothetical protein